MKPIDLLIQPRWVVPIEPHNTVYENHAVAISQGRILAVLPREQAAQLYQARQTLNLDTHALMPGLINTHTHSPMTLFRGMSDDLQLMDWLNNHIWPAEKKWMNEEFIADGTELAALEMLRCGTTCFNENYFYADTIARVVDTIGMRASIGSVVIDFPTNYANTPDEYIEKTIHSFNTWRHHALIQITIAPHAPYTVSDENFLKIKKAAELHDLIIHLHLHETHDEMIQGMQKYNKRPLKRIDDLGLASFRLQCVHMTQIDDDDIKILQKTNSHVIHCPQSNLKLASGFCPVKKLMDAGINVALGTDGAASNNDLDMFNEMQTAAILAKAVSKNPTALSAADALQMATLNGAKAIGLAHEIGSIQAGKSADLIAIDLNHINTQPVYNPISHLVYALNSQQVSDVWVAGKQLLKNGEFTTLNKKNVLEKANLWQTRLKKST